MKFSVISFSVGPLHTSSLNCLVVYLTSTSFSLSLFGFGESNVPGVNVNRRLLSQLWPEEALLVWRASLLHFLPSQGQCERKRKVPVLLTFLPMFQFGHRCCSDASIDGQSEKDFHQEKYAPKITTLTRNQQFCRYIQQHSWFRVTMAVFKKNIKIQNHSQNQYWNYLQIFEIL